MVAVPPHEPGDRLATLLVAGSALTVLLVESPAPDWRLTIAGIPLNPIIFLCVTLLALSLSTFAASMQMLAFPISCLLLPSLYGLLLSTDPTYATSKALYPIASTLVAFCLLNHLLLTVKWATVANFLLLPLLCLLATAVVYKLQHGFFDRQVLFFLHGPIIFGRLMGLGFILSAFFLRGCTRLLTCLAFMLAVAWTGSKGPLLCIIVLTVLILGRTWRGRFALAVLMGSIIVFSEELLNLSAVFPSLERVNSVLSGFWAGKDAYEYSEGSVAPRLNMVTASLGLIADYPWGVGLGSWASYAGIPPFVYPHNFFLEVYSELGLVFGTMFCIPYIGFLTRRPGPWFFVALFFMLSQQTSGDLLDSRYWLVFALVHFFHGQRYGSGRPLVCRPTAGNETQLAAPRREWGAGGGLRCRSGKRAPVAASRGRGPMVKFD